MPVLKQGRLERTETNLMHFKWEVTWTHGNQLNTFWMGRRVNSHFVNKICKRWQYALQFCTMEDSLERIYTWIHHRARKIVVNWANRFLWHRRLKNTGLLKILIPLRELSFSHSHDEILYKNLVSQGPSDRVSRFPEQLCIAVRLATL